MARLADAHREQIKVLLKEGKVVKEILEIMDRTYSGVSFVPSQIYYVKKEIKTDSQAVDPSVVGKKKRKYTKKKAAAEGENSEIIKEIVTLLSEVQDGYKSVFKYLRSELIRSRGEVCKMLAGAGLPEIESEIEE